MSYLEEVDGQLIARPAEVIGTAERCAICHEPRTGHDRRGRKHAYEPEQGVMLRVTFPIDRRPASKEPPPVEVVDYPFVAIGDTANQYREGTK